jgi:hypothetical protein
MLVSVLLFSWWTTLATAQFSALTSVSLQVCFQSGSKVTFPLSPPAPAGSSLLVGSHNTGRTPMTMSDNVGTNYTMANSILLCGLTDRTILFYALKLNATVTSLTFPEVPGFYDVFAMVYTPALSGLYSTAVQGGTNANAGVLTTPLVTDQTELLAIQFVKQGTGGGPPVPDPPFLARSGACSNLWADARLSSPTTINASFSYPINPLCGWDMIVAIFTTSLSSLPFPTGVTGGTLPGSYTIRYGDRLCVVVCNTDIFFAVLDKRLHCRLH